MRNYERPGDNSTTLIIAIVIAFLLIGKPIIDSIKSIFGNVENASDSVGSIMSHLPGVSNPVKEAIISTTSAVGSPFSPSYWKSITAAKLLPVQIVDEMCDSVNEAVGYWSLDFPVVFAQFKKCSFKSQVSWFADRYATKYLSDLSSVVYNTDLIHFRRSLSDEQMKQVVDYVSSLPVGS